jgi:hypothetical protein
MSEGGLLSADGVAQLALDGVDEQLRIFGS